MKFVLALVLCAAGLVSLRQTKRRNLGAYYGRIPSPTPFWLRQPAVRAGLAFGVVAGAILAPSWELSHAPRVSIGPAAFLAVLGALGGSVAGLFAVNLGFVVVRAFRAEPKLPLEPGELVRFAARANQVFRGERRQGSLVLTTTRFAFCPRRFAVQLETWSVPLSAIDRLECPGPTVFVIHAPTLAEPGIFLAPSSAAIVERMRECGVGLELVRSDGATSS